MQRIITASGPVIVEDGKVLLIKDSSEDFYVFCGGKIRNTEDFTKSAIREAKKRLGIKINILNHVPFLMYTKRKTDGTEHDVILVHYLASRQGEIKPKVKDWAWIDIKNLKKEKIADNVIPALKYFGFIID